MTTALTVISDVTLPAALGPDLAAAIDLAKAEKAASTRKAYGTDFRLFEAWCATRSVAAMPAAPETVPLIWRPTLARPTRQRLAGASPRSGTLIN